MVLRQTGSSRANGQGQRARDLAAAAEHPRRRPADPGSAEYEAYLPAFNLRTAVAPALRTLGKSEAAVAAMVNWVRDQNVPFANSLRRRRSIFARVFQLEALLGVSAKEPFKAARCGIA